MHRERNFSGALLEKRDNCREHSLRSRYFIRMEIDFRTNDSFVNTSWEEKSTSSDRLLLNNTQIE